MRNWLDGLLEQSSYFMPHGHCYLWIPSILWLHVVSDLLIGAAYLGISCVLWLLVRRLRLPFSPVFVAFGLFIALCGGTHFMAIWTTWQPDYLADGLVKAATALASVATAIGLLYVKPQVEEVVHAARLSEERRTQLESAHAELELLYRKVTQLDELKSQFFANVSHELRTPLALILGPAQQMMADPALPAAHRRTLATMHDNAQALLKQVNDLLDMAKLDAGSMRLQPDAVDLAAWLRRVAGLFEPLAAGRGMQLQLQAPATLPAVVDAAKLERVLVNLLGNAFKFAGDGGTVEVRLHGEPSAPARLRLEVTDNGPGVPPEQRQLVFERFRQGDGGIARAHGGTGLGLAIVKDFVELHGGSVQVDDAPGGGALFRVDLPWQRPEALPEQAPAGTSDEAGRTALQVTVRELQPQPAGDAQHRPAATADAQAAARVLVVEDHHEMREFIAQVLAGHYDVTTAKDGAEGLLRAEALQPDLIVSDLMMPGSSGEQLLAALRQRTGPLATTPVLLLSARADDGQRARLLAEGAQDYLVKPFAPAELLARVRNLVAAKRAGDLLRAELDTMSTDLEDLSRRLGVQHRQLQTALDAAQVAREQAERASQVKTAFLGMVSHELRTPLATIHLNLQLLLRDPTVELPPRLQPKLDRLTSAARQMNVLVEGLLDYTQVESGRLQVTRVPVDLPRLAAQVVEESRLNLVGRPVDIQLEAPAGGGLQVHTDERLLKVVVNNLVANAVKFTEQGCITVRVLAADDERVIEVQDTGPGIAPEDLDRIFLPFESLEPVHRKSVPGMGLGLALVQQIVQALGGRVSVSSVLGQGSRFRVHLPGTGDAAPA